MAKDSQLRDKLGPVYMGLDKFGTGPLRDLIGSVPKRSHESGAKLFQIARPFLHETG